MDELSNISKNDLLWTNWERKPGMMGIFVSFQNFSISEDPFCMKIINKSCSFQTNFVSFELIWVQILSVPI